MVSRSERHGSKERLGHDVRGRQDLEREAAVGAEAGSRHGDAHGEVVPPVINPSPHLVAYGKIEDLRAAFVKHVRSASQFDMARRDAGETTTNAPTLETVLAERLRTIDAMRREDFVDAFLLFEGYSQGAHDENLLAKALPALSLANPKKSHMTVLNRWLKRVFISLWNDRLVLFPLSFRLGSSFTKSELRTMLPPLAACFLDAPDREGTAFGIGLTLSTNWKTFADIDLDHFGAFSMQLGEDHIKRGMLGLRARNPYSRFTAALKQWSRSGAGQGFRYGDRDVANYFYWLDLARRCATTLKFSEFLPEAEERRKTVKETGKIKATRRLAAAQVELIDHEDRQSLRQAIMDGTKSLREVRFEAAAGKVARPEDILVYAKMVRGKGNGRTFGEAYPGRMHAFPDRVWSRWSDTFERWTAFKKRQGFEHIAGWDTVRYVFQDYLCLYLPWYAELLGEELRLPADPAEFGRFGHWVEEQQLNGPLPLTRFFDATRAGKGRDGFNSFVADCHGFFEFCRGSAPVLGFRRETFDNPVVPALDRMVVRGASKTNKSPIPRSVVPYLLRYAYECERFIMAASDLSIAGELTTEQRRAIAQVGYAGRPYDAELFGMAPTVDVDGRSHPIREVPPIAPWADRFIRGAEGATFIPQLSGLRLVIAALETGIRFQGLQWLCRKTYRSLAETVQEDAALVPLVVNTDKVRDRPWRTLVVRRVFELLRREEAYQERMADGLFDRVVNYEKRDNTRFAPVLPLFRGPQSEYPIADQGYARVWERLIVGFGGWYASTFPEREALNMWSFEPDPDPLTGKPQVVMHVDGSEERECCPLRLRLRHTPHSARATFITSRSGILPIEVTGWLVGHTNKATTYHYTVESDAEVGAKVAAAAEGLWSPDPANPVHIRADQVRSALRRSFDADRRGTESAFGFQTLSLLNDDEVEGTDGIALLRTSAMGNVVFRETHICPVGEMCPTNVLDVIVEPRRCGLCPLAVKSVDHLPSIGARMRRLLEQAREGSALQERMRARGEPMATLDEITDRRRLDVMEYEGWRASLLALTATLSQLEGAAPETFHVGMPDAVRLHLKMVARDVEVAEFVLQRIDDSAAHAAFETPTLRAQAAQLRQRLMSSSKALDAEIDLLEGDPVMALVSSLKVALDARGVTPTFRAALDAVSAGLRLSSERRTRRLAAPAEA